MPDYRLTVTAEIKVTADNEAEANRIARSSFTMPPSARLMAPLDITEPKELRSVDRRLVTQIPKVSAEKLHSLVAKMSDIEQAIIVLCVEPQWAHHVYTTLRKAHPTLATSDIAKIITRFQNEGWLHTVAHHIEQDSFPQLGVAAQYSSSTRKALEVKP